MLAKLLCPLTLMCCVGMSKSRALFLFVLPARSGNVLRCGLFTGIIRSDQTFLFWTGSTSELMRGRQPYVAAECLTVPLLRLFSLLPFVSKLLLTRYLIQTDRKLHLFHLFLSRTLREFQTRLLSRIQGWNPGSSPGHDTKSCLLSRVTMALPSPADGVQIVRYGSGALVDVRLLNVRTTDGGLGVKCVLQRKEGEKTVESSLLKVRSSVAAPTGKGCLQVSLTTILAVWRGERFQTFCGS